jgi:plastocyanin
MKLENHRKNWLPAALCALACWVCLSPPALRASVLTNVDILDNAFSPMDVTIKVNDQVMWTWTGSLQHSTTADSLLWDSGVNTAPFVFTNTFSTAGTYSYSCVVHGFTGSITVQAGVVPPTVNISAPTNGATFAAPWTGTIQASASSANGTISNVDFYAGTNRLGSVSNPSANPSLAVTNLAAGSYTLTAVATDSVGASNTSAGVTITVVTPVPILLSSFQRLSASAFQFNYTANPALSYVVQRSATLKNFIPLSTNTASSSPVTFRDNNATGAVNFYRVMRLPNP